MQCAHHVSLALPTWQLSGITKCDVKVYFSFPSFRLHTQRLSKDTKGGTEASYETGKLFNKTNIVWCAHHVSLAALIALPTWQLSGIAK